MIHHIGKGALEEISVKPNIIKQSDLGVGSPLKKVHRPPNVAKGLCKSIQTNSG